MNELFNQKAELLFKAKQARKYYEAMEKLYLSELLTVTKKQPMSGQVYSLKMIERKGSVDYSSIPELKGINLDTYRKESTVTWTLTENLTKPEGI